MYSFPCSTAIPQLDRGTAMCATTCATHAISKGDFIYIYDAEKWILSTNVAAPCA